MNDKTRRMFIVFFAGLVFGLALGVVGAGIRSGTGSAELRKHFEQVNRDLDTAISAQREAAGRAAGLQAELHGIRDHARSLEEGTRRVEARAGSLGARTESLADNLDGIAERSGELADGIKRASGSLEESRILLDELGVILRSLPAGFGAED